MLEVVVAAAVVVAVLAAAVLEAAAVLAVVVVAAIKLSAEDSKPVKAKMSILSCWNKCVKSCCKKKANPAVVAAAAAVVVVAIPVVLRALMGPPHLNTALRSAAAVVVVVVLLVLTWRVSAKQFKWLNSPSKVHKLEVVVAAAVSVVIPVLRRVHMVPPQGPAVAMVPLSRLKHRSYSFLA